MSLIRLDISDFRNLSLVRLDPLAAGFNFFYGNNGSGKTSLLEVIYYLSRGRSFRSSVSDHIINRTSDKFSIFAQVQAQNQQAMPVGIERRRNGRARIRIAGEDETSFTELVRLTPALLINSACYSLLDAGPIFRRKYLDWGAFYIKNDFLASWKRYQRALRQRNAALRGRVSKKGVDVWTVELIQSGLSLDKLRREFVEQLLPFLQRALAELLVVMPGLNICYQPGWDENTSYERAMAQSMDKDIYMGHTHFGPHRGDLELTINQTPVKDILSRGQQKLFVCAMIVAQGALLQQCVNRKPIYLIDDLPSELDLISRSNLMMLLSRQEAQVFLTSVERDALSDFACRVPMRMFHVEHGTVTEE